MSSFSGEFLKRSVVDINGDLFGHLVDIVIEPRSGEITEILVEVIPEIDITKLPWPSESGLCHVPAQEISPTSAHSLLPTSHTVPVRSSTISSVETPLSS